MQPLQVILRAEDVQGQPGYLPLMGWTRPQEPRMNMFRDAAKAIGMAMLSAGCMCLGNASAQSDAGKAVPARAHASNGKTSPYLPMKIPKHARNYYQLYGGIENVSVRQTASGNLIRFSYRVTDPARAKVLGEKNATPYMLGLRSNAVLQIPVMDKIGQLRQTGVAEVGQEYWMVFSNKGNLVKAGDRVNVVVGSFHVDGLLVE
jgi:hypothetical protein